MSVCPVMTYGSFQQKNIGISSACTIQTPNKHIIMLHVCLFGHSDIIIIIITDSTVLIM